MFDDLHDPAPPSAGLDTLASVSARAKAIRRRRLVWASTASVVAVALVAAAVILPGRDRASIAPADSEPAASSVPSGASMSECDALTDPVWLPNGDLPGRSESISGIDPFSGDRVDGRTWLSPEGYGLLVRLPPTDDVFDLPASGQTWDLRVRDARPNVDSVEVTIWRRADRCVARYLVPGDVETAAAWGGTFVDMLTAATAEGPISRDADRCVLVLGRRSTCISLAMIDPTATTGSIASSLETVAPEDVEGGVQLRQGFGVVQHVVGAGDEISPRSRLSFETSIEGTALKSVVDLIPPNENWCGSIRRASGEIGYIGVSLPVVVGAGESAEAPAGAGCDFPDEPPAPSTTQPSDAAPTTRVEVDPECLASLAPVWLPDGSAADEPFGTSLVILPDGSEVEAISWGSRRTGNVLTQLSTLDSAHTFDGFQPQLAYDLDVDAMDENLSLITIARRSDGCTAQHLFEGAVDEARVFATSWVDQMTVADDWLTLVEDPDGIYCPAVTGITRGDECLGVDPLGEPSGGAVKGFVIRSDGFGNPLFNPVGVVLVLIPADADVFPHSRLAQEEILGDTGWKAVLDVVQADAYRCLEIRDGSTRFSIATSVAGDIGTCPIDRADSASAPARPPVAIDASGDAVVFREPDVATVVQEGADPDDPPPAEGPVTYIDGVAATADGSTVMVGVCCEPSAGALWRHDATGGEGAFLTYGHLPALTSHGNLVWYAFGLVNIGGLDGSIATTLLELDPSEWTVTDLAVVQRGSEPEEVLLLASRSDGTYLWRVFVGGGDMQLSQRVSERSQQASELSLAGFTEEQFLILDKGTGLLDFVDARTLQPIPTDQNPVEWISAWITPSGERYVDDGGVLWVDGTSWGGDYRWVR